MTEEAYHLATVSLESSSSSVARRVLEEISADAIPTTGIDFTLPLYT